MKIKITKPGIFGANGEVPVGTELTVKQAPAGWEGRYEEIGKKAEADAEPVVNPAPTPASTNPQLSDEEKAKLDAAMAADKTPPAKG